MQCPVGFYTFTAWILCISMTVTDGELADDCDETYAHLSNDCTSVCDKKGAGLHRTFSCHHYCFCRKNRDFGKHRTCPDGMVFNHLIENCDYQNGYKCPERPPPPANYKCPTSKGIFKYPRCCELLIICANDRPHVYFCPSRLHFSITRNSCDYPANANCSPDDETSVTSGDTGTSVTTDQPVTPTIWSPPPVIGPPETCKGDQFYPHKNCSHFYHCDIGGRAHEKICAANLHWNVQINVCDYQCNAKCDKNLRCENRHL